MATWTHNQSVVETFAREAADKVAFLPCQFFPARAEPLSGELSLILTLLEDLVVCLLKEAQRVTHSTHPYARMRTYLEEDLNYLLDKDIKFRDYPLSFSRCCFALDLDPDVTRERILQQVWAASVRDDSRLPRRHKEAQHTKRERRAA